MNNQLHIVDLEPRQKALYQKLFKKPILAKIYIGALHILQQENNPDRFALSAHNLRELMEKMPLYVDIGIKPPVSLGGKVRELYESWVSCGLNDQTENKSSSFIINKEMEIIRKVKVFFDWYKNHNSTRRDQLKGTLRELDPGKRPIPSALEDINAKFWEEIREYFLRVAHHNKEPDEKEFMGYLFYLEDFLLIRLKPRVFEDIEEIDAIIGE
jgi:hypothetical protein